MDNITFWNRIAESSPLIVLILLGGYVVAGKLFMSLLGRLDRKDEQIMAMSREMLTAIGAVTEAVEKLTEALRDADRRH